MLIGKPQYIDPSVHIPVSAHVGNNSVIYSGCFIAEHCSIGNNTILHPNIVIYPNTTIGDNCVIRSNTTIGNYGFEYIVEDGVWKKQLSTKKTIICADVDIGANCTIDIGSTRDTIIGTGTKIDSQVHIGHDVQIGEHTAIAGCTGIAGNVTIGSYCKIAGAVGIAGNIEICDNTTITGMSAVSKSITIPGIYSSGIPVRPNRDWNVILARLGQLTKLNMTVQGILKKLKGR